MIAIAQLEKYKLILDFLTLLYINSIINKSFALLIYLKLIKT